MTFLGEVGPAIRYVLSPDLGTRSKGQHFGACGFCVVFFFSNICHSSQVRTVIDDDLAKSPKDSGSCWFQNKSFHFQCDRVFYSEIQMPRSREEREAPVGSGAWM